MAIQAKSSLWYTICNFFQKGIAFIVVPIYVRFLTTAEYGEWSVFQAWVGILIVFATLNLYAGVYTKTLVDLEDAKDRDRYTSSMQGLGTLVSIVFFIVYIFTHSWCNKLFNLDTNFMVLLFVYFIVYPAFSFWSTRKRVEYHYKAMVVITALVSIITPVVSLVLLHYTELRTKALILGFLGTQCAVGIIFYVYHFFKGKCFFDKEYWRYALKFNIPLIPHYLSLIVLGQSDRIMIKYFCGESDAGIYSFAYQITSVISVLISAIDGSRVPWTYEQLKNGVFDRLKRITNVLTVMMSAITLLLCLMAPEIIAILGTEKYSAAMYVIPIVALGAYFTFVYSTYASVEFYYGATKYVMYASVLGAVLNIILNAAFIPLFGFIAAAYTTLLCYVIFMFLHFLFSRRVLRNQGVKERVFDSKTIFFVSLLLVAICFVTMTTFDYIVLRLIIVFVIIGFCVAKRNRIKELIEEIKR